MKALQGIRGFPPIGRTKSGYILKMEVMKEVCSFAYLLGLMF